MLVKLHVTQTMRKLYLPVIDYHRLNINLESNTDLSAEKQIH